MRIFVNKQNGVRWLYAFTLAGITAIVASSFKKYEAIGSDPTTTWLVITIWSLYYRSAIWIIITFVSWQALPPQDLTQGIDLNKCDRLIITLRTRSKRLRIGAIYALSLVLLVFCAGAYIFISAEESARTAQDQGINSLIEMIASLENDLEADSAKIDDMKANKKAFENAACNYDCYNARVSSYKIRSDYLKKLLEKKLAAETGDSSSSINLATISTKTGAVVLMVFLVQLLINLYRYNIRLAVFYDSRADLLMLSDIGNNLNEELIKALLSSDGFDFGKPPTLPIQQILDAAKAMNSTKNGA